MQTRQSTARPCLPGSRSLRWLAHVGFAWPAPNTSLLLTAQEAVKRGFWLTFWRLQGLCCLADALHTYSSLKWFQSRTVDITVLHFYQRLVLFFSVHTDLLLLVIFCGRDEVTFCFLAVNRRGSHPGRSEPVVSPGRVIPSSRDSSICEPGVVLDCPCLSWQRAIP